VRSAAAGCADAPVWSLSDTDLVACLSEVRAAEQALAAVRLHLVRQVDARGLAGVQHERSVASWLRSRLLVRATTGKAWATAATAVDQRPNLDRALVAGHLNVEHVAVIDACLRELPTDLGTEVADKAEAVLIGWAAELCPAELRKAADRILVHVAPEVAEAVEAKRLEADERRAHASRFLRFSLPFNGKVRFTGLLDVESAAIVHAALDPLVSPRTLATTFSDADAATAAAHSAAACASAWTATGSTADASSAAGTLQADASAAGASAAGASGIAADGLSHDRAAADHRSFDERRADALVEVCRLVLNTGDLPVNGGDRPPAGGDRPVHRAAGPGRGGNPGHRATALTDPGPQTRLRRPDPARRARRRRSSPRRRPDPASRHRSSTPRPGPPGRWVCVPGM
jgi:hypothetical protein